MVTEYDPVGYRIGFVKVTPGATVVRIRITLHADDAGGTLAEVSYTYTALSEEGETIVGEMTEAAHGVFMREWEEALNRFLSRVSNDSSERDIEIRGDTG